jgi:integrase
VRHLQEHKERQDAERQALRNAWREHGLVFASSIGTPIEPRNVNRRWDELRRRAGLDWLRPCDLRHGCAMFLLAKGVPDRLMSIRGVPLMGPTPASTTAWLVTLRSWMRLSRIGLTRRGHRAALAAQQEWDLPQWCLRRGREDGAAR